MWCIWTTEFRLCLSYYKQHRASGDLALEETTPKVCGWTVMHLFSPLETGSHIFGKHRVCKTESINDIFQKIDGYFVFRVTPVSEFLWTNVMWIAELYEALWGQQKCGSISLEKLSCELTPLPYSIQLFLHMASLRKTTRRLLIQFSFSCCWCKFAHFYWFTE